MSSSSGYMSSSLVYAKIKKKDFKIIFSNFRVFSLVSTNSAQLQYSPFLFLVISDSYTHMISGFEPKLLEIGSIFKMRSVILCP